MLDSNVIMRCGDLAQVLSEKNVTLRPLQDTPLAMLNSQSSTLALALRTKPLADVTFAEGNEILVEASKNSEHGQALNELVELGVKGVSATLGYARNTVIPEIKAVCATYEELLQERLNKVSDPYTVEQRFVPDVWQSGLAAEIVAPFEAAPIRNLTPRGLGEPSNEQIAERLTSGIGELDNGLHALLAENNDVGYNQVRRLVAGQITVEQFDRTFLLAAVQLLRGLADSPLAGVNMSLDDYRRYHTELLVQVGGNAYRYLKLLEANERNGVLFAAPYSSDTPGIIQVNAAVYADWLDKGLTPEALIGNELDGRRYTRPAELTNPETVKALEAIYQRYHRLGEQKAKLSNQMIRRDLFNKVLALDLQERAAEKRFPEAIAETPFWAQRLNKAASLITDKGLEDPYQAFSAVICAAYHAHSDAWRVVEIINELGVEYPDTDARELATLATVKYVALWSLSQFAIVTA